MPQTPEARDRRTWRRTTPLLGTRHFKKTNSVRQGRVRTLVSNGRPLETIERSELSSTVTGLRT